MTLPNDEWVRISHFFSGNNVPTGAAVVYAAFIDAGTFTTLDALATEVHDAFGDHIMPRVTDDVALQTTLVKRGPDATGPSTEVSGTRAGGISATSLAPNTAWLVTKSTAFGGRRGRGRMYVPGASADSVNDQGVMDGAYLTGQQTAVDAWLTNLLTRNGFGELALEHEPSKPGTENPTTPPAEPSIVTALTVSSLVATQRRRLRR